MGVRKDTRRKNEWWWKDDGRLKAEEQKLNMRRELEEGRERHLMWCEVAKVTPKYGIVKTANARQHTYSPKETKKYLRVTKGVMTTDILMIIVREIITL